MSTINDSQQCQEIYRCMLLSDNVTHKQKKAATNDKSVDSETRRWHWYHSFM